MKQSVIFRKFIQDIIVIIAFFFFNFANGIFDDADVCKKINMKSLEIVYVRQYWKNKKSKIKYSLVVVHSRKIPIAPVYEVLIVKTNNYEKTFT